MSTFSKSFASLGGFIAGDEPVMHYIKHHARSLIFSASIPPSNAAAALAALKIMRDEPERVEHLSRIADYMRKGYRAARLQHRQHDHADHSGHHRRTDADPVCLEAPVRRGRFCQSGARARVQPGRELLRTSYMATHTFEQMDRVLASSRRWAKRPA